MFAGHEPSSNTLLFDLIPPACHPGIQQGLQHHIDNVIGIDDSILNSANSSPYLNRYDTLSQRMVGAVIHETMRLFPGLPFLAKSVPLESTTQPFKLSNKHVHMIQINTPILANTSTVHGHP